MRSMLVRLVCGLCLFNLAIVDATWATTVWGPVYDSESNANLYVVPKGTWMQAEAAAQQMGGNLATVHSAAENAFIVSNILQDFTGVGGPNLSAVQVWIGLYDPTGIAGANEGTIGGPNSQHAANFTWVDGSTSTYRNWLGGPGNPSPDPNGPGSEFYVDINWAPANGVPGNQYQGTWTDDTPDGFPGGGYGLVSVPVPEPSTLLLLGIGAVSMMAYAWRKQRRTA
jgi:hypothetical protein